MAGAQVGKALAYAVVGPPGGVSTAKAGAYAVVRPATFFTAGDAPISISANADLLAYHPPSYLPAADATISISATADVVEGGGDEAFGDAGISVDASADLHAAVLLAGGATITLGAVLGLGSIGPIAGDALIALDAAASLKNVPAVVGSGFVFLQHRDATVEETLATGAAEDWTVRAPPRLPLVTDQDRPTTRFLFGERAAQEYLVAEVNPKAPLTRTLRAVSYDPLLYAQDKAAPTEE